ncbi:MAG: 1,4-alpha-glucan branching protein GlgB [Gammaproteobacteria bacterium]|nr:1,4-alpha-glucan branching protein GlgB [Gammaproteobacteria bacterium]
MDHKVDIRQITPEMQRIIDSRHHDPFSVLGQHEQGEAALVRLFLPKVQWVEFAESGEALQRIEGSDFFIWQGAKGQLSSHYRLRGELSDGQSFERYDPYCFSAQLGELDIHLFNEGKHWHAYRFLGAHQHTVDGIDGVLFAVWAPGAERISVVGEFNGWDGRCHPMRVRGGSGVWELFIPELPLGSLYKFEIRNAQHGSISLKSDPYGQFFEQRPNTASVVLGESQYGWQDSNWMEVRKKRDWLQEPLSIYELHLGSWQRGEDNGFINYRQIAEQLVPYVKKLGFTHIELLPISEHPLDASWGYQTTGFYAPTSRFGSPDDFRYLIDHCHQNGIGVLLDWVPAHFPKDAHGLGRFDGEALYEHADPRQGEHRDWGTLIFNYGRSEVKNFLISNAIYWMEEFHLDGLRVDAVASMLYLDYSREPDEWIPNEHGGRENLQAIAFLREMNEIVHARFAGAMVMAEESTSWPQVTRPTWLGGLGFSMKWNMGWMHDSLDYFQQDPVYRQYHQDKLTFGLMYAFQENFALPFSHDEVVHEKGSMIAKMPGDEWQKFANLRLLYTYLFTYPGKKLLFMGAEFAQYSEWNEDVSLDWLLLADTKHQGIQQLVGDLNGLYRNQTALYKHDFDGQGFEWIDCHDSSQSVLSYLRHSENETLVVVLNFTPIPRENYRIGLPESGEYEVLFNSDSTYYGGSNVGNAARFSSEAETWMGKSDSVALTLPPLAGLILRRC